MRGRCPGRRRPSGGFARLTGAVAVMLGIAGHAAGAGVADWAGRLGSNLALPAADMLDSGNLPAVLGGLLDAQVTAERRCQPAVNLALVPGTGLTLAGEIAGFPARTACPQAVPLSLLTVGLQASTADDVQGARSAMLAALPAPCFDGVLPTDRRRHVPPSHMTVWANTHRFLTFVWDEYDPTIFTVAYIRRDLTLPDTAEQATYADVRDTLLIPIPAACLGQAGR